MRLSLCAGFFVVLVGCGRASSPQPDLGTGDFDGSRCSGEKHAFADALSQPHPCSSDSDCSQYYALCASAGSGNCAGIFYVQTSEVTELDNLRVALEQCAGASCNGGPSCGLAGLPAACVLGLCTGRARQ
jgi:hypothetical protein